MMDSNVFRDISYGLYIISTKYNERNVGCVINTLSQVTSENPIISCSINKNNYTNEAIKSVNKFAVSIISEKINPDTIFKFGYNSSKNVDKFENCVYEENEGIPAVTDGMCSYLICELVQTVDCGTHDIFIGRVISTKKLNQEKEMTYHYYHEVIKAVAPKNAPTYINNQADDAEKNNKQSVIVGNNSNSTNKDNEEIIKDSKHTKTEDEISKEVNGKIKTKEHKKGTNGTFAKYKCIVCGYIYDEAIEKVKFEDLPKDWKCPRCGVGKENFVKVT